MKERKVERYILSQVHPPFGPMSASMQHVIEQGEKGRMCGSDAQMAKSSFKSLMVSSGQVTGWPMVRESS